MLKRILLALLVVLILAAPALAQVIAPPSTWHPYRGGTNCIQVADARGNFNCAAGTTVDPATGNMVIVGTLSFAGLTAATFSNGLALASVGSTVQLLGPGDLAVSTSPDLTVATSGPLFRGAVLRVRQVGPGLCQWVTAGGNGFEEYVIPTLDWLGQVQATFPGGPAGC